MLQLRLVEPNKLKTNKQTGDVTGVYTTPLSQAVLEKNQINQAKPPNGPHYRKCTGEKGMLNSPAG